MLRASKRRIEKQINGLVSNGIKVHDLASSEYLVKPPRETGESNPKCYARHLDSCAGLITREHFISKIVLEKVDTINPSGIPWLAHLNKNVDESYFKTKCLCKKHNEHLSPLDTFAGKAFDVLKSFGQNQAETAVIWGPTLEKWFLKVLIGLIATNQLSDDRGNLSIEHIPQEWVDCLFGIKPFEYGLGLFSANLIGEKVKAGLCFTLLHLDGVLKGIRASFGNVEFFFSMEKKHISFRKDDPRFEQIIYHPNTFDYPTKKSSIHFHWD